MPTETRPLGRLGARTLVCPFEGLRPAAYGGSTISRDVRLLFFLGETPLIRARNTTNRAFDRHPAYTRIRLPVARASAQVGPLGQSVRAPRTGPWAAALAVADS
jgi:hypothetical protein